MHVATAALVVTASIFVWGLVSARLERADLTAPIVFVVVGVILAALGLVDSSAAPESAQAAGGAHSRMGALLRRLAGPGSRPSA